MAITIEEIDTATAPESLLRDLHEHYIVHDAEKNPDDPPMPWEQRLGIWRHLLDHLDIRRWILRDDGQIVAVAVVAMDRYEDLNNGFARIHVHPDHRRRGHGTRLAAPVLAALEQGERGSVITDTPDGAPWEPVLERLGMKKAHQSRESRLDVIDIDWDLMDEWIERASDRASDYELRYLKFPVEEELIQKWCDVMDVMNTAPREALELEDFTMTPAKWRDIEEKDIARGMRLEAYVAVHRPTEFWAGISEIVFFEANPEQARQGDTGVHPDHRNRGLGRWLKAAMIKRFMDNHPEVLRIDTDNADSNEPMLSINVEMGYKPLRIEAAWQGDRATVQERLGLR